MPPTVFVDTNVLISGLLYRGNEAKVLELALDGKIKLVISKQVVEETKRTLVEKFGLKASLSETVVESWSKIAQIAEPTSDEVERFKHLISAKDAPILAAAVKSGAESMLTGDKAFHRDEIQRLIDVLTAKQFLERLRGHIFSPGVP